MQQRQHIEREREIESYDAFLMNRLKVNDGMSTTPGPY